MLKLLQSTDPAPACPDCSFFGPNTEIPKEKFPIKRDKCCTFLYPESVYSISWNRGPSGYCGPEGDCFDPK